MFPSAFPLSCKQRSHTQVVITGLEEWDKNIPFCSFLAHHSLLRLSLCSGVERKQWQKIEVNRRKWNDKTRKTREPERIYIYLYRAERQGDLYRGRSHNQFNHPIGNAFAQGCMCLMTETTRTHGIFVRPTKVWAWHAAFISGKSQIRYRFCPWSCKMCASCDHARQNRWAKLLQFAF